MLEEVSEDAVTVDLLEESEERELASVKVEEVEYVEPVEAVLREEIEPEDRLESDPEDNEE